MLQKSIIDLEDIGLKALQGNITNSWDVVPFNSPANMHQKQKGIIYGGPLCQD